MIDSQFEAAVGMSRKWDAREAGREVAETTIRQLNEPPTFFVLFTTIHYRKYGGFQELLHGVWDVLPKGTPLIGGTVRGFTNNFGCYTRGSTALAVSSPDIDVATGFGLSTKRNPQKAASHCAQMIEEGVKKSKFRNGFLFNLVSASELPDMPPFNKQKIIKDSTKIKIMMRMFGMTQYLIQKGAGRDDEVIEEMTACLPDYKMLGGGTIDDGPNLCNYQFYNDKVFTNSIVSLGIKTDYDIFVKTTHNMKMTNIKFSITKASKDGRIVHEINGKPAAKELLRLLKWPDDFLHDDTWYKITYYFPIGFKKENDNAFGPRIIGAIYGNSLVTVIRSHLTDGSILTIDGKNLLKAIDDNLSSTLMKPRFGLFSSCTTRLETLGRKIYQERDRITQYLKDAPFIEFYVGGESTYSPSNGLDFVNISFNSALIGT
ncbi:MAG TPA: FIST N-terminal domain-containing protein [Candidatus Thermoplasmatota archaeon]|nr:FIST N-terminal domain-containing protein [Candidatus Thermoplasmatota archaeon]